MPWGFCICFCAQAGSADTRNLAVRAKLFIKEANLELDLELTLMLIAG